MKNRIRKRSVTPFRTVAFLLGACLLVAPIFRAAAADLTWTNLTGGTLLWSDSANWTNAAGANAAPTATDSVNFKHQIGVTNAPGQVNSIVDAEIMVGTTTYSALEPGYDTTLINPGVTLLVSNSFPSTGFPFSYRGALTDSTKTGYVTIKGEAMIVGDTNSPNTSTGNQIEIFASATGSGVDGPFMATLDMSGLNYFACAPGEIKVGASGATQGTRGTWILAKTNLLIAGTPANTSASATVYGLIIGSATGGDYQPGGSMGELRLGQENVLRSKSLKVGGARAQMGALKFQSGLINPTLKIRNVDGVSPALDLAVGDAYRNTATIANAVSTANTSTGNADLSGGTVDVMLEYLFVGRNIRTSGTSSTRSGSANGTLTWTAGTISCSAEANMGVQDSNNPGSALGVINVRSNASFMVRDMYIGRDAGTASANAAGTGNGTLNIAYGGQVIVTNFIVEDYSSSINTGSSTVNLTNGTLTSFGPVTVDNLNLINSTSTVSGVMRLSNLTANNSAIGLTISAATTAANPACRVTNNVTLNSTVTFNVSGSGLTLTKYPLIKYTGSVAGGGSLVLGTQPAATFGYLTNNTATSSIDLVITNVPAVKWNGNVIGGNWDINTTANWINSITSVAATYQEVVPPGDPAIFDDTATGTKSVNLTTVLSPESVIVNTTNTVVPYTFIGAGWISGTAGLYKTGGGILELANSAANDYSGPTTVNAGTLRVNGSILSSTVTVQAGGTLGGTGTLSGPVTIGSAATLAPGNGIGMLTFNNTLVMSAGSSNLFEVNSDTLMADQVMPFAGATYGGNLIVAASGSGAAFTSGAEIQLFNPPGSGAFAATYLPPLSAGLAWDTSTLNIDGKIRVFTIPAGNLLTWTNIAAGDLLWSNPANWIRTNDAYAGGPWGNSTPTANDRLYFTSSNGSAFAATNVAGAVNNIVDADTTITNLLFDPIAPAFHTTLINPGVTLSVLDGYPVAKYPFSYRSTLADSSKTGYVTIKGEAMVVGDTNTPNPALDDRIEVFASASAAGADGPFMATLDMSGLNYFACAPGEIKVGASGVSQGTRGKWILARTNLLMAGVITNPAAATPTYGIIIGSATGGDFQPGGSMGEMQLGQENIIRANSVKVGGARAQLGTLKFQSGLINPTLTIRNVDGITPANDLGIGDNYRTGPLAQIVSTADTATGIVDFSGGTVDIMLKYLFAGRPLNREGTTNNGSANATLTWTAGTISCSIEANIGAQDKNNMANATAVYNVRSNATLMTLDLFVGRDAGTATTNASGTGSGILNIVHGGQVIVTNNCVEDYGASTNGGSSTVNLTNGTLIVGNLLKVDTLNVHSGTVTNIGLATVSNLKGGGTVSGPVAVTGILSPGNSIGTLSVFNDLTLSNTANSTMEINLDTLAGDKVVGLNNVTFGGALTVSNIGGTAAATNGATLQLFSAANYLGAFSATNLPALPSGLVWNTSGLANGTLMVVTGVNTTPTNLTFAVTGGGSTLDISWPSDRTGWRLQGQTNTINVGISSNWFTVPGSASTNHVIMPLDPANGAVFYRLIYP